MRPPSILVSDYTCLPAPTLLYTHITNTLNLHHTYTQIKYLSSQTKHTPIFLDLFWSSAAHLLDYFADFLVADKPAMQSIWFNMLDTWRQAGERTLIVLEENLLWKEFFNFTAEFNATLCLMRHTISGTTTGGLQESLIHVSRSSTPETSNPGTYISGLPPWAQFLSAGSPGYPPTQTSTTSTIPEEGHRHPPRHIPMPAISIIHRHTARTHALASALDADLLPAIHHHSLRLSQKPQTQPQSQSHPFHKTTSHPQTHTYTTNTNTDTNTNKKTISYHLTHSPIRRHTNYADPSLLMENPNWTLLDECVGLCMGLEAYVPVSSGDGNGDGDENEDENEEEERVGFDMWVVWEEEGSVDGDGVVDKYEDKEEEKERKMFRRWVV